MAGPQFFHIQSFARSPNKGGQSVEQVLAEAARDPRFSHHIEAPQDYRVVVGLTPQEVQQRHDEMVSAGGVTVALKDGKTARRGIRKDRHTLMTCVASHPHLTSQIQSDPTAKADYDAWVDRNVRFLRGLFGNQLVSIIEHVDEEHPHLHAYILPLNDMSCSARELNPCWVIKMEAEAKARETGHDEKAAVNFGHRAYRAKAREIQDQYYQKVGLASGLTRIGPRRRRLSRQQWRASKTAAVQAAKTLGQLTEMAGQLADREDALAHSFEQKASELVQRFEQVEALFADVEAERAHSGQELKRLAKEQAQDAEALKAAAERDAAKIVEAAQNTASQVEARADAILAQTQRERVTVKQELSHERQAFEVEKTALSQRVAKEAAAVAVRLIAGVLTGDVSLRPDNAGWFIRDDALRERAEALQIGSALRDLVSQVSGLWHRLSGKLSAADLADEKQRAVAMGQRFDPPPSTPRGGFEP